MISKHYQLLNIINLSNTTEFNSEDQMDIDHNDELINKIKLYSVFYSNSNNIQTDVAIQLAIALNQLGTNSSLWTFATLFGKCEATILIFLDQLIFPMAVGAIDGTHIPLNEASSKINKDIYISCKHSYGIHLQGIVDYKEHFISYNIGWPVSVHDAKVFKNSCIYKQHNFFIEDEDYLLGNSAYPLLPWVMIPFKDPQGLLLNNKNIIIQFIAKQELLLNKLLVD
ncbi:11601_t:CDS:2 [Gigaspora rosea]|nr:11601_t:CDS:2 [Gigaspora rosea]